MRFARAAIVLGFLLIAGPVAAWGPISHQVFGCRALAAHDASCFETPSRRSFVVGQSAPDAFKLNLEDGRLLHRFDYATFQLRYAESHPEASSPKFDALAYSRGFGAHLAQDYVGHRPNGYLPDRVGATKDHLHEFATDTFLANSLPGGYRSQYFSDLGDAAVQFSQASIRAYGQQIDQTGLANATHQDVAKAMVRFDRLEMGEQGATRLNPVDEQEMTALDPDGASSFSEAQDHLERAAACSIEAGQIWQQSLRDPTRSAAAGTRAVQVAVKALFDEKRCQAQSTQESKFP